MTRDRANFEGIRREAEDERPPYGASGREPMKPYEIGWAALPEPVGTRPVLLLTRDGAYDHLNRVLAGTGPVVLALTLTLSACGGRTGLSFHEESSVPTEAGTSFDSDAPADAPLDARMQPCPLTPTSAAFCSPDPSPLCASDAGGLECIYVAALDPIKVGKAFCCTMGVWNDCTDPLLAMGSCSGMLCMPGRFVECIVEEGSECCVCNPSTLSVECGAC